MAWTPSSTVTVDTATHTFDVNPLILSVQCSHAKMMAKHGLPLARNAHTLAQIRAMYGLPGSIRTWAKMWPVLVSLKAAIDEHIEQYA